jgi:hypothetical protein
LQPGTRLDQYEIVGLLGEGGMGAVYRAEDTRLKRQVAIKVLPPELAADAERLARLEREAQLLASLNHPNVATVHGFGDVTVDIDGSPQRVTFLVMELVGGESLYDRALSGPMPWREVVDIGVGIAAGLEAAHERGIVHRDLKPANVHVADDGSVKVLDFGLAKAFENDGTSGSLDLSATPTMAAATRTGVILGTAAYMSPEQARGKAVDKRTDVWALGCVLYELLAGRKAFEGETVSDILAGILKEAPDFDALPPIPASLRHVMERCLEKHPSQRMRDVGDVRIELEAARKEPAIAAGVAASTGVSWRVAAAIAALGAIIGVTAAITLRSSEAPPPEAHVIVSADSVATGIQALAISPDGRWIAELGGGGGLRLRAMDQITWRDVAGTENASTVAFSADSQTVYLTTQGAGGEDGGSLKQLAVTGASPILVARLPVGFPIVFRGVNGDIFVSMLTGAPHTVSRLESNGSLVEVFAGTLEASGIVITAQVDATRWIGMEAIGTNVLGLALLDSESGKMTSFGAGYNTPVYLGEGRLLATDFEGRLVSLGIDLDTGEITEPPSALLEGLAILGGIVSAYAVADSGAFVYVAGQAAGVHQEFLSWLSPDGRVEPFSARGIEYQIDTFPSPDGTRVAAEFILDGDNAVTIHIHDIERDVSAPLVPGSQSSFPVWSPDSQRVAYFLQDDAAPGIYSAPINRSELPTLLVPKPDDAFVLPMHWAPDNSALLYVLSGDQFRSTNVELNDLWLQPLDGSEARPLIATAAREVDGRFSPDSRWIAYVSDQSGAREIYLRALAGGGEYQISATGGYSPEWNTRGDELYFLRNAEIYVVDVDVTGATPAVSPERMLVSMQGTRFKADLYAPWPGSDKFLVASHESGTEVARTVRAIFNWSVLAELR